MEQWNDVRVLVTGGSQGIGLGIATSFAEAGARVAVAGRTAARLESAQHALREQGLRVETVVGDVADEQSCFELVDAAGDRLGGLDVLCANAGIYPELPLADLTTQHVDSVIAANLRGTILSVQASLSMLKTSGRGRVVITSSITGPVTGYPELSVYAASKAGQLGFMRSAAVELAPFGITVNAICPGSIRTEGLQGLGPDAISSMERCIPVGRLGEPSDIGALAVFLASRSASFVTGQAMVVDGGQTLPELPL